jgi:nucleoside-triphosphatase THEP1
MLQTKMPHLRMCGFRTDEVRQQLGGRIGFDIVTLKDVRRPLSRITEQVRGTL